MLLDKYNRTNFLKKTLVDSVNEYDLVTNSINTFTFSREKSYYRVQEADIQRPDLIAIRAYKDVEAMKYWWVLCYINNIMDPWNDIAINDVWLIPDKKDLEEFLVHNRNS